MDEVVVLMMMRSSARWCEAKSRGRKPEAERDVLVAVVVEQGDFLRKESSEEGETAGRW